jgi:23S rRNA (uracil1939-C5)-methyltransferase
VRVVGGQTLLRVQAEPGVPGQVRRHLATIEHSVLGDERAGHAPSNRHVLEKYALDRPFLHRGRIECIHPESGERVRWESPLPGELATVLARMEARPSGPSAPE